ncbi:hypothetical protein Nepgr_010689 [Nepenthes gracilis]|uniref:Uncharacterized protein n=1 Tax=Nepenthes gracilis TaxID=150966 RepID=A0AAD3XLK3_NEPGR|nr:hypothetical protein Nepgr_010689 [Nepenthes gracilis]
MLAPQLDLRESIPEPQPESLELVIEPLPEPNTVRVEAAELASEPLAELAVELQARLLEPTDQLAADLPPEPTIEPVIILLVTEPPAELSEPI